MAFVWLGNPYQYELEDVLSQFKSFTYTMHTKERIEQIDEVCKYLFLQKYKHKVDEKIPVLKT